MGRRAFYPGCACWFSQLELAAAVQRYIKWYSRKPNRKIFQTIIDSGRLPLAG
jgi:hypothetical protein